MHGKQIRSLVFHLKLATSIGLLASLRSSEHMQGQLLQLSSMPGNLVSTTACTRVIPAFTQSSTQCVCYLFLLLLMKHEKRLGDSYPIRMEDFGIITP